MLSMKSLWLSLALAGLIPSMAAAADSPRDQYIAEIVKAVGIEDLLSQLQEDSKAYAQSVVDRMMGQMKDLMARLPEAKQQQFRQAVDRFIAAACQPLDNSDAAAQWGRFFAADMSDDELRTIARSLGTSLGSKELKAATSAATQWAKYLQEKRMAQIDKATTQYVADLKALVAATPPPAPPSDAAPPKDPPAPK
jgi:hypothetical protein